MHAGLEERRRALDAAFFAERDAEQIEALRARRSVDALERATGIDDPDLLRLLMDEGLRPETLVALLLAPLVEIAWADGWVSALERNTFRAELGRIGIRPSSPAGCIMRRWLEEGPPKGLMEAWRAYVESLEETIDTEAYAGLGDHILRLCRSEADSDGGVLRIGRHTSPREARILREVESTLALI